MMFCTVVFPLYLRRFSDMLISNLILFFHLNKVKISSLKQAVSTLSPTKKTLLFENEQNTQAILL